MTQDLQQRTQEFKVVIGERGVDGGGRWWTKGDPIARFSSIEEARVYIKEVDPDGHGPGYHEDYLIIGPDNSIAGF